MGGYAKVTQKELVNKLELEVKAYLQYGKFYFTYTEVWTQCILNAGVLVLVNFYQYKIIAYVNRGFKPPSYLSTDINNTLFA